MAERKARKTDSEATCYVAGKMPGNRSGQYLIVMDGVHGIRELSAEDFGKESIRMGRSRDQNDLVLSSQAVSRIHGKFKVSEGRMFYADLGSTNGSILESSGCRRFLNKDQKYIQLMDGDMIRIQPEQDSAQEAVLILYMDSTEKGTWRKQPVLSGHISIGRDMDNDIVLSHPGVSRVHAKIEKTERGMLLKDEHSVNGTLLNGHTLSDSALLHEKDVIQILGSTLIFTNGVIYYKNLTRGVRIDVLDMNKYVGKKKKQILNHVNTTIDSNEFVAIIGGSGAGKSTLMNAISGFDKKTEGTVLFNGLDLKSHFAELKGLIGYVPQEDIIYENLTLRKMLYYTAKLKMPGDTSAREIENRISHVLEMVELTEHQNTFIRKLSGGQKKRASIAVEMLADPKLFFLDEPTSGLDPGTEQKLMITLSKLSKSQGKTIIMVTHTTQSLELCDKVIFMGQGGRLCFCGSTEQAKMFFDTENLVDIYNMISENAPFWEEQFRNCMEPEQAQVRKKNAGEAREKKRRTNPAKQLGILTSRYIELIRNDAQRLGMLLLQPVVIALLLSVVAKDTVFEIYEDTKSILFALSCAGIWIGLFNSIQEVCKERTILKREYMGNLRLPVYISSKFLVQTLLGAIQGMLMMLIFSLTVGLPEAGILLDHPAPELYLTLWLTIEASMALGFVVSSLVKTGDKAMTLAPFILIIQLLFSGILFELSGAGEWISYFTISKWSVEGLGSIAGLNDLTMKIQEQLPTAEHEFQEIFEAVSGHLYQVWGILLAMTLLCGALCMILLRSLSRDSR